MLCLIALLKHGGVDSKFWMGSKRKLSIVRYTRSQQVIDKIVIICDSYFLKKNYFKVKMDFVFSDIKKSYFRCVGESIIRNYCDYQSNCALQVIVILDSFYASLFHFLKHLLTFFSSSSSSSDFI